MDTLRFEELKHTITYGGLPNMDNETFTADQVDELKPILEERAKQSMEYIVGLKTEPKA